MDIKRFQKNTVKDIARDLTIHPFDVVRIAGELPSKLAFEKSTAEKIRKAGGIEVWWKDARIEEDTIHARGVLRSIVQELIQRGIHGKKTTRADNVYRGMQPEDELYARKALNLLVQERFIRTVSTPAGQHVSIIAEKLPVLNRIAVGTELPAGLAVLWK